MHLLYRVINPYSALTAFILLGFSNLQVRPREATWQQGTVARGRTSALDWSTLPGPFPGIDTWLLKINLVRQF